MWVIFLEREGVDLRLQGAFVDGDDLRMEEVMFCELDRDNHGADNSICALQQGLDDALEMALDLLDAFGVLWRLGVGRVLQQTEKLRLVAAVEAAADDSIESESAAGELS